jgi:alpha-tubulin suppressor-like RCC1 family protein
MSSAASSSIEGASAVNILNVHPLSSSSSSSSSPSSFPTATSSSAAAAPPPPSYGELVYAGCVSHPVTGKSVIPDKDSTSLWTFHRISNLIGVKIRDVICGPGSSHYFAITVDGILYAWGRNDRGQLGLGHTTNVNTPTIVPKLPPISSASSSKTHSLLIAVDGQVFAAGDNEFGQCSFQRSSEQPLLKFSPVQSMLDGKVNQAPFTAISVAAGNDFSAAVSTDGRLYTCGSQRDGQTGSGVTGETIISAGKVGFGEIDRFTLVAATSALRFTMVAAGISHCGAISVDGQAYTWGSGSYGRLGHNSPADELTPKAIKVFEPERLRVKSISCGGKSTFFVTRSNDMMFFSGISKMVGESNMVPRYFNDLQGWRIRSVSSGNSHVVVAAERSVVTWGAGSQGELAYGPGSKSSAKAKIVDTLEGLHVIKVASGYGASLAILDTFSDHPQAEKARQQCTNGSIPTFVPPSDPKQVEEMVDTSSSSSGKRKAEKDDEPAEDKKKAKKATKK